MKNFGIGRRLYVNKKKRIHMESMGSSGALKGSQRMDPFISR